MKKIITLLFLGILLSACGGDDDETVTSNCSQPSNLSAFVGISNAFVEWDGVDGTIANYTFEYGEVGFELGSGTLAITSATEVEITGLNPSTAYDGYVRTNCSSSNISTYVGPLLFTTQECNPVGEVFIELVEQTTAQIFWETPNNNDGFEVEYGPQGFTIGAGTKITVNNANGTDLTGLTPATAYDLYVRTKCGEAFSADSPVKQFMTEANCATQTDLSGSADSDTLFVSWNPNGETAFVIEYGEVGFELGSGIMINTSQNVFNIEGVMSNTTYEIYVRANCGSEGFSNYSDALVLTTN